MGLEGVPILGGRVVSVILHAKSSLPCPSGIMSDFQTFGKLIHRIGLINYQ
jgi:hypothetical protein